MKLFDVIVDKKELHPDFVRCQKDKYKVEVLEEWADDDLIYRDGNNKFVKEFQTTFNSALWELYCNQVLKKLECKIDLIKEDICDGLSLYVNPYAKNKISNEILDIFFDNGINIIEYNIQYDEDIARVHDLSLIQRHVITLEPGRIKIDFPQMFM